MPHAGAVKSKMISLAAIIYNLSYFQSSGEPHLSAYSLPELAPPERGAYCYARGLQSLFAPRAHGFGTPRLGRAYLYFRIGSAKYGDANCTRMLFFLQSLRVVPHPHPELSQVRSAKALGLAVLQGDSLSKFVLAGRESTDCRLSLTAFRNLLRTTAPLSLVLPQFSLEEDHYFHTVPDQPIYPRPQSLDQMLLKKQSEWLEEAIDLKKGIQRPPDPELSFKLLATLSGQEYKDDALQFFLAKHFLDSSPPDYYRAFQHLSKTFTSEHYGNSSKCLAAFLLTYGLGVQSDVEQANRVFKQYYSSPICVRLLSGMFFNRNHNPLNLQAVDLLKLMLGYADLGYSSFILNVNQVFGQGILMHPDCDYQARTFKKYFQQDGILHQHLLALKIALSHRAELPAFLKAAELVAYGSTLGLDALVYILDVLKPNLELQFALEIDAQLEELAGDNFSLFKLAGPLNYGTVRLNASQLRADALKKCPAYKGLFCQFLIVKEQLSSRARNASSGLNKQTQKQDQADEQQDSEGGVAHNRAKTEQQLTREQIARLQKIAERKTNFSFVLESRELLAVHYLETNSTLSGDYFRTALGSYYQEQALLQWLSWCYTGGQVGLAQPFVLAVLGLILKTCADRRRKLNLRRLEEEEA